MVQLLEDVEGSTEAGPSSTSSIHSRAMPSTKPGSSGILDTAPAAFPAPISSLSDRALVLPPEIAQDEYSMLADNFLARLSIIERQPTKPPDPPSLLMAHLSSEDSIPESGGPFRDKSSVSSASLLPFDMQPLQRELLSANTTLQAQHDSRRTQRKGARISGLSDADSQDEDEERAEVNAIRRVEIDVEPEFREFMDQGWELLKQMRDSGDMQ